MVGFYYQKNIKIHKNGLYFLYPFFHAIIFIIRQAFLMGEKFCILQQLFIISNDVPVNALKNDIIELWYLMTCSSRDLRDNEIYIKNKIMNKKKKKNILSLTAWVLLSFNPSNELVAIRNLGGKFVLMNYWITKRHFSSSLQLFVLLTVHF